jgi:hypothetical protein
VTATFIGRTRRFWALDVVVSLADTETENPLLEKGSSAWPGRFSGDLGDHLYFVLRFVNRPIRKLIAGTESVSGEITPPAWR